jgi:hypothetical protein
VLTDFPSYLLGILVTVVGLQFLQAGAAKLRAHARSADARTSKDKLNLAVAAAEMFGGAGLMVGSVVGTTIIVLLIMVTMALKLISDAEREDRRDKDDPELDELSTPEVLQKYAQAIIAVSPLLFPVTTASVAVLPCALLLLIVGKVALRHRHAESPAH